MLRCFLRARRPLPQGLMERSTVRLPLVKGPPPRSIRRFFDWSWGDGRRRPKNKNSPHSNAIFARGCLESDQITLDEKGPVRLYRGGVRDYGCSNARTKNLQARRAGHGPILRSFFPRFSQ